MSDMDQWDDLDVIPPKTPVSDSLDISPDISPAEVELAFTTNGNFLCRKLLVALVIAMVNDPTGA